jgi:hypothetical protein
VLVKPVRERGRVVRVIVRHGIEAREFQQDLGGEVGGGDGRPGAIGHEGRADVREGRLAVEGLGDVEPFTSAAAGGSAAAADFGSLKDWCWQRIAGPLLRHGAVGGLCHRCAGHGPGARRGEVYAPATDARRADDRSREGDNALSQIAVHDCSASWR